jgi:hypothetical protein
VRVVGEWGGLTQLTKLIINRHKAMLIFALILNDFLFSLVG